MSKSKSLEDFEEIKAILVGDSGVGKTNLINTSVGIPFVEGRRPTISGSFVSKKIKANNDKEFIVNLWDTAGQETYRDVTKLFFKGSEIILLVYDITTKKSFESLKEWAKIAEDIIETEHIYGVVGNKNDLYLENQVSDNEVKEFADSLKAKYKLVSAKTDPQSFSDMLKDLVEDLKKIDKRKYTKSIKLKKNVETKKSSCFGWFSKIFKKSDQSN
jgi:small GTP-binding protein